MEWSLLTQSPWLPWLLLATCTSVTLALPQDMACVPAEYNQTTAPLNSANRIFVDVGFMYYAMKIEEDYPKDTKRVFLDENQRMNISYWFGHFAGLKQQLKPNVLYIWYNGTTVKAAMASVFQNMTCYDQNEDAELEWGCVSMELEHEGDTAKEIYTQRVSCGPFGDKMELRWVADWVQDSPDLACFNEEFPGISTGNATGDFNSKRFVTLNITQVIIDKDSPRLSDNSTSSTQKESKLYNLTEGKVTYMSLYSTDYTSAGFKNVPRNLTMLYSDGQVYLGIGTLQEVLYPLKLNTNSLSRVTKWPCNFETNATLDVANTSDSWGRRFYLHEVQEYNDITATHEEWVLVQLPNTAVQVFGNLVLMMTLLSYVILSV